MTPAHFNQQMLASQLSVIEITLLLFDIYINVI